MIGWFRYKQAIPASEKFYIFAALYIFVWTIKQTYLIAPIFRTDSIENLYVSLFATYSIIFF